jgi:hypothetical protein
MDNTILIKKCIDKECYEAQLSGNNILVPVLFGIVIGFLIANVNADAIKKIN